MFACVSTRTGTGAMRTSEISSCSSSAKSMHAFFVMRRPSTILALASSSPPAPPKPPKRAVVREHGKRTHSIITPSLKGAEERAPATCFRALLEALARTQPTPDGVRKHLHALCRHPRASGSTLPTPECVQKHLIALCRHQSASGSTCAHSASHANRSTGQRNTTQPSTVLARPVCPYVRDSDSLRVPASPRTHAPRPHTQTGPPVSATRPSLVLFSRALCA